jgi:hypothetical protein
MRKITTAITAAALAFSMLAQAVPAAAVAGYDSAYAGESAFVFIQPGQTQNFQVFFANTGTTAWQRGTGTQVDLAACLEDKVTCNAQDASEASWNSGWLSPTRYTSTVQTITPPGSLGTFSYNITAPAGVAAGIFRFNGDLVLASTGERIHPEGYYQEANTGTGAGGAATITDLDPDEGSTDGGDNVVITGSGIVCTPAFPTVSFGGTNAVVTSCGATSLTTVSPAHAEGDVTVTVTNSGAPASNGLTFDYEDTTDPTFVSMTVSGDLLMVTFSEGVCSDTGGTEADWNVTNISNPTGDLAAGGTYGTNVPDCADDEELTTITITLSAPVPPGAFVEATLNEVPAASGENVNYEDAAGNAANAPQSRQATATALETTQPDLISASGNVSSSTITLTFSEPIYCTGLDPATEIDVEDEDGNDITVGGFGSDPCTTVRADAETTFNITLGDQIESDTTYTVTINYDAVAPEDIRDAANNGLDDNEVSFTAGAGDFTPPTMVDARITSNVGTTDFREDDDAFSVTFSEVMDEDTTNDSLQLQDQDGTVITVTCTGGVNNVVCDWNDAATTLTVTVNVPTLTVPTLGQPGEGTTPGMQIPFNITTLSGFSDAQGNVPNVLGSSDRLVDFE